jgi:chromosome segregation protein
LTKEVDDLQESRSRIESELTDIRSKLRVAEDDYTTSDKDNSRLKLELVGLEGRLSTLRSNRGRFDELKNDILETIGSRTGQQSELLTISAESKRTVREHEAELKSEYARTEEKRAETVRISTAVSELDAKIKKMDEELKVLRREETATLEKTHELDLELSSVRSRKSNLIEDSVEHYEFDPSTSSLEVKLSDDQLADLSEQLATLRRRLDGLGPVNMLALDEYDEQSKRYHFLSEQLADLTTAKEDLKSTISKINTTAKRLFTETLESVRSNFQDVFKELFEGGSADVRLEEGVDPLEANIIITARPRGKKILSIQQLSGGERALTSISLLFSLYLVKPSPFCILDEVDAPLDDANIARFLKMIKRFSEGTQFVIITHNKLTMEAADVLYGVTMHQPGVSQIVSVNLNSAEERDALLSEAPVEEPQAEEAVEVEQ